MNATTPSSMLAAQALDFRSTAVDLAAQLQQATRDALQVADDLARAERIVNILAKYMPESQMIHARLEINEDALLAPGVLTSAACDVLAERRRQRVQEGWTLDHDDAHEGGELAEAAMCYADPAAHCQLGIPHQWPWTAEWWKPRDRRRNLVRAGALIMAKIERIDRAESTQRVSILWAHDSAEIIPRAAPYRQYVEHGLATKEDVRAASADQETEQ